MAGRPPTTGQPLTPEEHRRRDLLGIDKYKLDDAAETNSQLIYEWGLVLNKARSEFKRVHRTTKLVLAKCKAVVRAEPVRYGLTVRSGNEVVEAAAVLLKDYAEAQEREAQAEDHAASLEVFMEALRDRKYQISNLCDLYGMMYFRRSDTTGLRPSEAKREADMADTAVRPRRRPGEVLDPNQSEVTDARPPA